MKVSLEDALLRIEALSEAERLAVLAQIQELIAKYKTETYDEATVAIIVGGGADEGGLTDEQIHLIRADAQASECTDDMLVAALLGAFLKFHLFK
jgi:hypothetical protein